MAGASLHLLFITLSSCILLGRAAGGERECEGEDANRLAGWTLERVCGCAGKGVHGQDSSGKAPPARPGLKTPLGTAWRGGSAEFMLKDDFVGMIMVRK